MFNFYISQKIQNIIEQSLNHCPIIILGDFDVDILKDNNHAPKKKQEILNFMDKFELNSQFNGSTTKVGSQLDDI
jgi:hypothetical protein